MEHFESLYPDTTRFEEIKKILEYIKAGKSVELIALPGTGRSNLLGFLSYNKNIKLKHLGENTKWFHFVYMDFSEVRKRTSFDIIKFILISTAYSLSERGLKSEYESVNNIIKEAITFQDELILFQALKRSIDYLAIEKELTVVFLFDRFEQAIPAIGEEFFLNLKILRNRAKYRFSCIFSQTRPLEDILDAGIYTEFYEYFGGNNIYLSLYDPPGTMFRFQYIEKVTGKKLSEDVRKQIIALTGGHGKLTRLAYEAVLSDEKHDKPVIARNVTHSEAIPKMDEIAALSRQSGIARNDKEKATNLNEFLFNRSTIQNALLEIWNSLTPREQYALKAISEQKKPDHIPAYLENTGLVINQQYIRHAEFSSASRNASIQPHGTLKQVQGDVQRIIYNISIPLLSELVKTTAVENTEKITYNTETNEIHEGNDPITERLSPSEFRLLRFLIQNSERVCEKDEVIQAVWKDTQTQEGVTDQALDQVIYRLRKKIEKDPNQPVHLQTIKGRGFKFVP